MNIVIYVNLVMSVCSSYQSLSRSVQLSTSGSLISGSTMSGSLVAGMPAGFDQYVYGNDVADDGSCCCLLKRRLVTWLSVCLVWLVWS